MESASHIAAPVVALVAGWLAIQIMQGTWFCILGNFAVGSVGALVGGSILPPEAAINLGVGVIVPFMNATIGALLLLLPFWLSGSSAEESDEGESEDEDAEEMERDAGHRELPRRWRREDAGRLDTGVALAFHH
jgi:uncharacterized membrane protein YeaQ/YmgE (transglycosylase-associated protein family)